MVARRSSIAGVGAHSSDLALHTGAVTMDADGVLAHFVGWVRSGTVAPQGASALAECRPTHGVRRPRRFHALGAASSIVRRPNLFRNLSLCRCVALSLCRAGTGYGAAPHVGRPWRPQRSPGARRDDLVALAPGRQAWGRIRPLDSVFVVREPPCGAGAHGGRDARSAARLPWACPFTTKLTRHRLLIGKTRCKLCRSRPVLKGITPPRPPPRVLWAPQLRLEAQCRH